MYVGSCSIGARVTLGTPIIDGVRWEKDYQGCTCYAITRWVAHMTEEGQRGWHITVYLRKRTSPGLDKQTYANIRRWRERADDLRLLFAADFDDLDWTT